MIVSTLLLAVGAVVGVPLFFTLYIYVAERLVAPFHFHLREKIRPWLWLLPAYALIGVFLFWR